MTGVGESLKEYGRGLAGGLLFALPLFYTQEVWRLGGETSPARLLVAVVATFALLSLYNRYAGLRSDTGWAEVAVDSVEEFGLGLVVAAATLAALGALHGGGFGEIIGAVVTEGCFAAVGVSIGTAQLGENPVESDRKPGLAGQVAVAVCGAVFVAANVAPTDETVILAATTGPGGALVLVGLALALAVLVDAVSGFRGGRPFETSMPRRLFAPLATYGVAVAVSAGMLWFFGRLEGGGAGYAARNIAVLALPASLGASAGRLILQI